MCRPEYCYEVTWYVSYLSTARYSGTCNILLIYLREIVARYQIGGPDSEFQCLVIILQAQTLVLQNQHRVLEGWIHRVTILFVVDSWQIKVLNTARWRYVIFSEKIKYSKVSFYDGSFYDDSLLRPLSSRTEHSRLVVHHCSNSSVLSLLSALLALFRCACVSSFSILVHFF
jgi:hypothetical protein